MKNFWTSRSRDKLERLVPQHCFQRENGETPNILINKDCGKITWLRWLPVPRKQLVRNVGSSRLRIRCSYSKAVQKKTKKNYNIKYRYIVFHNFLMLNQCCGAAQVNYTKLLVRSFFTKSQHTLVKLDPNPHEKKQPDPDPHKKGMRIHSPGVYAIL